MYLIAVRWLSLWNGLFRGAVDEDLQYHADMEVVDSTSLTGLLI
jgi:hypothetical protein